MVANPIASTPECANFCPRCGVQFAEAGPRKDDESWPYLECGGCGAKYIVIEAK